MVPFYGCCGANVWFMEHISDPIQFELLLTRLANNSAVTLGVFILAGPQNDNFKKILKKWGNYVKPAHQDVMSMSSRRNLSVFSFNVSEWQRKKGDWVKDKPKTSVRALATKKTVPPKPKVRRLFSSRLMKKRLS